MAQTASSVTTLIKSYTTNIIISHLSLLDLRVNSRCPCWKLSVFYACLKDTAYASVSLSLHVKEPKLCHH